MRGEGEAGRVGEWEDESRRVRVGRGWWEGEGSHPSTSNTRVSIEGSSNTWLLLISSQRGLQLGSGGIVEHRSTAVQQLKLIGVGVIGVLQ